MQIASKKTFNKIETLQDTFEFEEYKQLNRGFIISVGKNTYKISNDDATDDTKRFFEKQSINDFNYKMDVDLKLKEFDVKIIDKKFFIELDKNGRIVNIEEMSLEK